MILDCLKEEQCLSLSELVEKTGIPLSTLRRDIDELFSLQKVIKIRGGAMLNGSAGQEQASNEPFFSSRQEKNPEEKARIAEAAMEYIQSGDTIIIDSGTTTYELSRLLTKQNTLDNIMIATNDIYSAMSLATNSAINLILIGGKVRGEHYSVVGYFGEQMLKSIHADTAFVSADSVDLNQGIMTFSLEEVGVKKQMIADAKKVILLVDESKFHAIAFVKIEDLDSIDVIITSKDVSKTIVQHLEDKGIEVVLV